MAYRISVYYELPEGGDGHFDMDYYVDTHVPMVWDLLHPRGMRTMDVDKGLAGGAPGAPAPYAAVGHMLWDSIEAFQAAMGETGREITGDVPNYTNITPVVQIAEVVVARS